MADQYEPLVDFQSANLPPPPPPPSKPNPPPPIATTPAPPPPTPVVQSTPQPSEAVQKKEEPPPLPPPPPAPKADISIQKSTKIVNNNEKSSFCSSSIPFLVTGGILTIIGLALCIFTIMFL